MVKRLIIFVVSLTCCVFIGIVVRAQPTNITVRQINHKGPWNDIYRNKENNKVLSLMPDGRVFCSFVPEGVNIKYKVAMNIDKSDTILVLQLSTPDGPHHTSVDTMGGLFTNEFQILHINGDTLNRDIYMGKNIIKEFRDKWKDR